MWTLIKGWWDDYVDLMAHSYLLDETYMELNMDQELGRGECQYDKETDQRPIWYQARTCGHQRT